MGNKGGAKGVICEWGGLWWLLGEEKVLSSLDLFLGSVLDELAVTY